MRVHEKYEELFQGNVLWFGDENGHAITMCQYQPTLYRFRDREMICANEEIIVPKDANGNVKAVILYCGKSLRWEDGEEFTQEEVDDFLDFLGAVASRGGWQGIYVKGIFDPPGKK